MIPFELPILIILGLFDILFPFFFILFLHFSAFFIINFGFIFVSPKESSLKKQGELLRSTLRRNEIAKKLRKRRIGNKHENQFIEEYIS